MGRTMMAEFIVTEVSTVYNVIIGRPILYEFCAIICIRYLFMKMPYDNGSITIRGRQFEVKYCHSISLGSTDAEEVLLTEPMEVGSNEVE